jgi:drug/metabolite transporter (DMT)-like permease
VSPEHVRAWIRVVRDAVLILAGTATFTVVLALYVVRDEPPNLTLIGAASAFFGLGVVLRADELIVRNGSNGGAKRVDETA